MPSQTRIDANRANARKSTGPKTEAGKAASSQNATKDGFYSSGIFDLDEIMGGGFKMGTLNLVEVGHDLAGRYLQGDVLYGRCAIKGLRQLVAVNLRRCCRRQRTA